MSRAPKDDQGFHISVTKHRKGVKIQHDNLGWFVLDRENVRALCLLLDQKTAIGISAPKDWEMSR